MSAGLCRCGKECRVGQRDCRDCHNAFMRVWRKSTPLTAEQRTKMVCHSYSNVYLQRGNIVKQSCRYPGCGKAAQMHHPDYSEPLRVIWLCHEHHRLVHSSEEAAARVDGLFAPLRFKTPCRAAQVALLAGLIALSGCASLPQPPAVQPIQIEHTTYIALPAADLAACMLPAGKPVTNGDLTLHDQAAMIDLLDCNKQLARARSHNAAPVASTHNEPP